MSGIGIGASVRRKEDRRFLTGNGGIAQGLGQAMLENAVYDDEGQLISDSYMNYTMPRADNMRDLKLGFSRVPSPLNPLGVKGYGEAGAIASPAALMNAVIQALSPLGVKDMDMPATPQRIWRAIQNAAA